MLAPPRLKTGEQIGYPYHLRSVVEVRKRSPVSERMKCQVCVNGECLFCYGRGRTPCPSCFAVPDEDCFTCGGEYYIPCDVCRETGRRQTCGGTGEVGLR